MKIKYLIIPIIIIIILFFHNKEDVKYIKSSIDNNKYVVLNNTDSHQAANTLAEIKKRLIILQKYLENNHTSHNVQTIKKRFNPNNISEGSPDSSYTSYTVNKGEKMVFCIRDKKTKKIHDINLMMYVAIHEFAHVYTLNEVGHGKEFKKNFKYLLDISEKLGLYHKINFSNQNIEYCGMKL